MGARENKKDDILHQMSDGATIQMSKKLKYGEKVAVTKEEEQLPYDSGYGDYTQEKYENPDDFENWDTLHLN